MFVHVSWMTFGLVNHVNNGQYMYDYIPALLLDVNTLKTSQSVKCIASGIGYMWLDQSIHSSIQA